MESKVAVPLGKHLAETSLKVSEILAAKTFDSYWTSLVTQMETASNQGQTSIDVTIKDPPFTFDDKNNIKNCGFYKRLAQKCESESLSISIYWTHSDCSHIEDCGSGCKANTIKISWL